MSDLEEYVADLWSQTLGVPVTGPDEDFFELGGHSRLVLACLAEVQDRFPDATIQDFFANPTVRTLAARLAALSEPAVQA